MMGFPLIQTGKQSSGEELLWKWDLRSNGPEILIILYTSSFRNTLHVVAHSPVEFQAWHTHRFFWWHQETPMKITERPFLTFTSSPISLLVCPTLVQGPASHPHILVLCFWVVFFFSPNSQNVKAWYSSFPCFSTGIWPRKRIPQNPN